MSYYAIYRDLQGNTRSAGSFATEQAATRAWQRAEDDLDRGRTADPKRGRQRLRRYVEDEWFPNHEIEATTREGYRYLLDRYILPALGGMRMREILPVDVRQWVVAMKADGVGAPTIKHCKAIVDAIFTTALNDQIVSLHAGKGVRTPPVASKPKRIITAEQFELIYDALPDGQMRLLAEIDIESGLRWGELTELRPKDLDRSTGMVTVSRVVVHLKSKDLSPDQRFVIKHYPKDREWRQLRLAPHVMERVGAYIDEEGLGPDDLLFRMPRSGRYAARLHRPAVLPDPSTLGLTEPNDSGRRYSHGTLTAYQAGRCRCRLCKDAVAAYRAERRAAGRDQPRTPRQVSSDGHIPNSWFRTRIWNPAVEAAELGFRVTPHALRHAHASWLLAGGADLQVVKERLGHGPITTTERYLHTLPTADDAALAALDAMRATRGPRPDSPQAASLAPEVELAELRAMVGRMNQLLGTSASPSPAAR